MPASSHPSPKIGPMVNYAPSRVIGDRVPRLLPATGPRCALAGKIRLFCSHTLPPHLLAGPCLFGRAEQIPLRGERLPVLPTPLSRRASVPLLKILSRAKSGPSSFLRC